MKLYLVGGRVRDHLMHAPPSKDYDFAAEASSYEEMRTCLISMGVHIWQERPEFVTIRGQLPTTGTPTRNFGGLAFYGNGNLPVNGDFTLCRAETQYSDKRHPDTVTPASLAVDLSRRDFTVNAVAVSPDGIFFDPYDGRGDAKRNLLKCVGHPADRFVEDPLRILRAIRFATRYKMILDHDLAHSLRSPEAAAMLQTLPVERVREELGKAFNHDTWGTVNFLTRYAPPIMASLARNFPNLWLKPTTEAR